MDPSSLSYYMHIKYCPKYHPEIQQNYLNYDHTHVTNESNIDSVDKHKMCLTLMEVEYYYINNLHSTRY